MELGCQAETSSNGAPQGNVLVMLTARPAPPPHGVTLLVGKRSLDPLH